MDINGATTEVRVLLVDTGPWDLSASAVRAGDHGNGFLTMLVDDRSLSLLLSRAY